MPEEPRSIAALDASLVERNRASGFPDLDTGRKAFCIKFVTNGYKHREAAKDAGFSPNTGSALKKEPLVAAYINDLMDQYLAESLVNKQTLDVYLDELEDIAMGRVSIPMITGNGDSVDGKKFHADLAMKVFVERSKLHGIIKEDSKGSGTINVIINTQGMTGPVEVQGEVIESDE